jgi:ABC-2 type transport system ATP-binding protein
MPVIATRGLTKRFGKTVAVDDLSLEVEVGQVFGFLGPNGSGKTTTIAMLLGLIRPSAGELSMFGLTGRRGLHAARQRIGATLDIPSFYPFLGGHDNLRIVANLRGVEGPAIERALRNVGLFERRRDRFGAYSLGMKQRLAIAAALLGDPELVVLDEPMNGLDPEGMQEVRDLLASLAAGGKTIFLSSHLLHEVERSCTHAAIVRHGRIVRQAAMDDLLASGVAVRIVAGDPEALRAAALEYPDSESAEVRGDGVIVRLRSDDPGALNRYLAGRGIYVSVLTPHRSTLEEAFIGLTRSAEEVGDGQAGDAAGEEAP